MFNLNSINGWNYYPNFRTIANISASYSGVENLQPYGSEKKHWQNHLMVNAGLSYYVSPQFRISCNLALNYVDKTYLSADSKREDTLHLACNIGFNYAIF